MIRYILTEGGIKDQETGACIPVDEGNRHYQEYLEWLEAENVPIALQPSEFHELVEDKWVLNQKRQWESIREERNKLLLLSDYTQLGDVSLSIRTVIADWKKYRQALRNIPQDFTNPNKIVWPEKPSEPHNGEIK